MNSCLAAVYSILTLSGVSSKSELARFDSICSCQIKKHIEQLQGLLTQTNLNLIGSHPPRALNCELAEE
jgi:hypothetical protein